MTTLNVSGTAERFVAPERAVAHIRINHSSLTKGEAYRDVVAIHNSLVARARGFQRDGSATWFDASAPSTYSHQEYYEKISGRKGEHGVRMRYAASSRISVKFQDFDQLGEWLAELADIELVSSSVEWKLTDVTRKAVQKEIRGEAVRNARELAEDYAQGDATLATEVDSLKIVSISDGSAPQHDYYPSPLRGAVMARSAGAAAPAAEMSPEDIQISASIFVVFEV